MVKIFTCYRFLGRVSISSSTVLYGVVLNDPQEVISEGSEAEARTETFLPSVFCALEDMMQNLDLVLHD